MATTRDYIDYLNDQVDIAPTNSQEELQAAQLIQSLMEEHGLETKLQEFDAPSGGNLAYRLVMVLLFIGIVLSGFYGTPVAAVGVVLVFLSGALFLLRRLGYDFLSGLGTRARSQNVIGVHRAEGPLVMKGSRPIVIVAHYDTPRESLLYASGIARFQPLIKRIAPICIVLACALGIAQLFGFVPVVARRVLWVIGLLVALPLLFMGVDAIYQRFSSYTEGANDNKAAVAAMLGVLDKVRPGQDVATGYARAAAERRAAARASQPVIDEPKAQVTAGAAEEDLAEGDFGFDLDEPFDYEGMEDLDEPDGFASYDEFDEVDQPESVQEDAVAEQDEPVDDFVENDAMWEYVPESEDSQPEAVEDEAPQKAYVEQEQPSDADAYADDVVFDDEGAWESLDGEDAEPYDEQFDAEGEDLQAPAAAGAAGFFGGLLARLGIGRKQPEGDVADGFAEYEVLDDEYVDEQDEPAFDEEPAAEYGDEAYEDEVAPAEATVDEAAFVVDELDEPYDADTEAVVEDFGQAEAANDEEPSPVVDEAAPAETEEPQGEPEVPEFATYEELVVQDEAFEELSDLDEPADVSEPVELGEDAHAFAPSFARVHRHEPVLEPDPVAEPEGLPQQDAEPEIVPQVVTDRYEEVVGIRHGEEVIRSLRMLPTSCEIEYIAPKLLSRTVRPQDDLDRETFGVISSGASNEWDPIERPHRDSRRRRKNEPRQSLFSKIGSFFGNLRDQLFGEDDDYAYDDERDYRADERRQQAAYEDDDFSADADAEYMNYPAEDAAYDEAPLYDEAPVYDEAPAYDEVPQGAEDQYAGYEDEPVADEQYGTYAAEPEQFADFDDEFDEYPMDEPDEPTAATQPVDVGDVTPQSDVSILAPGIAFEYEPEPTEEEIDQMDGSGLTQVVEDDLGDTNPNLIQPAPKAEAVDDPNWGRSEYQPVRRNVARRASLFDLPDPSAATSDPFASGRGSYRVLDDDDTERGHWKGGATVRSGLRAVEDDALAEVSSLEDFAELEARSADVEQQEELRDAILGMRDDELVAHDIWFVALGASELDHAGMKSFLREYRSKIRGAFLINLDCIGAGDLSLLSREGQLAGRRTDRRVLRMLTNIAEDLHVPVERVDYGWDETDATPAMRKSVRAVTIMGMEDGVAALSHTADDTPDSVDPSQASAVTAMIAELIRRA